jgi:heme-degrading monooxygenase HmoA
MIARVWYGKTPEDKGESYLEVLKKTGVKSIQATEGNRGVLVLRRTVGETAQFVFISLWDSMEAIKKFAGPNPERAFYYPEDDQYLLEKSLTLDHFEVMVAPENVPEPAAGSPRAAGGPTSS